MAMNKHKKRRIRRFSRCKSRRLSDCSTTPSPYLKPVLPILHHQTTPVASILNQSTTDNAHLHATNRNYDLILIWVFMDDMLHTYVSTTQDTAVSQVRFNHRCSLARRRFASRKISRRKLTNVLPSFAGAFSGPPAAPAPTTLAGGVLLLTALPPSSLVVAPYALLLPALVLVLVDPRLCR